MTINEAQDEVIAEFSDFDDWMDRYQLLIDLGNEQAPLDEKYKTDQNLIEGCQSRVWLQADEVDGKLVFQAESDALIVKGIIALLIKVLSGHTPDEILNADLYFIDRIGLREHLSPTRSNGFFIKTILHLFVLQQIPRLALQHLADGFQGGEAYGLGLPRLEDGEVGGGDAYPLGQLVQGHLAAGHHNIQIYDDGHGLFRSSFLSLKLFAVYDFEPTGAAFDGSVPQIHAAV